MLKIKRVGESAIDPFPAWPPLRRFALGDKARLEALLRTGSHALHEELAALRADPERHGEHVMTSLATLYAHYFDYLDAPDLSDVEDGEAHLVRVKRLLEIEMLEGVLGFEPPDTSAFDDDQAAVADHLEALSLANPGVRHPLFDYIADEMPAAQMREFLWLEVMRNEIVDDEVAMLVPGLQHSMKQVVASNLWDECGNGRIDGFHTTWLLRLLSHGDEWEAFLSYRERRPWVSSTTSNAFNALLTNPANRFRAYGTFLVNESWVAEHFERILRGMDRVGIHDEDRRIYFDAHFKIDQHHRLEMIEGLRRQVPALGRRRLREVLEGAYQAIRAGEVMYDGLLAHFRAGETAKARAS